MKKERVLTKAAFQYAANRFGNEKLDWSGVSALQQYACREGFYAGVEWQKEQLKDNPTTIKSLIQIFSTPIAQRKGVTFSPDECNEWVKFLKQEQE